MQYQTYPTLHLFFFFWAAMILMKATCFYLGPFVWGCYAILICDVHFVDWKTNKLGKVKPVKIKILDEQCLDFRFIKAGVKIYWQRKYLYFDSPPTGLILLVMAYLRMRSSLTYIMKSLSIVICSVSGVAWLSCLQSRKVIFCFSWKENDSEPRSSETTVNSRTDVEVATMETHKKSY